MTNFLLPVALAASLLAAGSPRSDEVRLKDGRVLVGVVHRGDKVWEIETREGSVRVLASEVESCRSEAELRLALRDLEQSAGSTPFAHLQLAVQAHAWDLDDAMWKHLDDAVQVPDDAPHQGLRSRIDDFLAQLGPELLPRRCRAAETGVRVHELLEALPERASPGRLAAVGQLLAREPNADRELRSEARGNRAAWRRLCALDSLLHRGTRTNDQFVWRTAIFDPDAAVRGASMTLARSATDAAAAVQYLAPGLMHPSAEVRVRTGEAFAALDDRSALKLMVMAGPFAHKKLAEADQGIRAHIAFLNQQAYIRDFDVEVAQASFIADPKIAVLQDGAVLDVTVVDVTTERLRIVGSWRSALRKIAGSDPGADPRDWATWLGSLPQPAPEAAPGAAPTTPAPTTTAPTSPKRR